MLRVYLDQMAWIDLTKAAIGRPRRPEHADVLEIARYGVKQGLVEFPLSSVHYMETLQRRDATSREQVGRVMVELSQMRTITGPSELKEEEIDRALKARFGRPQTIRSSPIFGHGVGHAFGEEDYRYELPEGVVVDGETRLRLEAVLTETIERAMLAGPSAAFGVGAVPGIPRSRDLAAKHADEEQALGDLIRRGGFKGQRFRDAWTARGLMEAMGYITEALLRAGIPPTEFGALGKDGLTEFFLDLPALSTYWELRYLRHQDAAHLWKPNDLRDITFLSVAVVHCDVIVTERHWRHMLGRTGRPAKYGTRVESDVGAIRAILVAG
jgi:hypothetical protein